jgi:hypothetical protein
MSDETFAAVVRSFRRELPYVYAFQANAPDLLLLGSERPLEPRWPEVLARFARPAVRQQLGSVSIRDLGSLLALQRLSPATIDFIASLAPLENTDDNRFLEYRAPRDLFTKERVNLLARYDERRHASPALLWHDLVRRHPEAFSPLDALRMLHDPRFHVETLVGAYRVVVQKTHPAALRDPRPETSALYPDIFWIDPSPGPEDLAAAVPRFLRQGQRELAESLLDAYRTAILTEAALSPAVADAWRRHAEDWWEQMPGPTLHTLFIELLMTAGAGDRVSQEWSDVLSGQSVPPYEWAVLRACQTSEPACEQAIATYRKTAARPIMERLAQLRTERERPAR